MWMVANLTLAIPRWGHGNLEDVSSICADALAVLPHDHAARYLVYMLAEAQTLQRDFQGLKETGARFGMSFNSHRQEGEYFPKWQMYLNTLLPAAIEALNAGDTQAAKRASFTIWLHRLRKSLTPENPRRLAIIILRIFLALLILASYWASTFH
jgi:hypothetical protein